MSPCFSAEADFPVGVNEITIQVPLSKKFCAASIDSAKLF